MKSEATGTVLGVCGFKVKSFHAHGLKTTSVTYVTEVLVVRGPGAAEPGGSGSGPLKAASHLRAQLWGQRLCCSDGAPTAIGRRPNSSMAAQCGCCDPRRESLGRNPQHLNLARGMLLAVLVFCQSHRLNLHCLERELRGVSIKG